MLDYVRTIPALFAQCRTRLDSIATVAMLDYARTIPALFAQCRTRLDSIATVAMLDYVRTISGSGPKTIPGRASVYTRLLRATRGARNPNPEVLIAHCVTCM